MKLFNPKTAGVLCLLLLLALTRFAQAQGRPDLVWMHTGSFVQDVQLL